MENCNCTAPVSIGTPQSSDTCTAIGMGQPTAESLGEPTSVNTGTSCVGEQVEAACPYEARFFAAALAEEAAGAIARTLTLRELPSEKSNTTVP